MILTTDNSQVPQGEPVSVLLPGKGGGFRGGFAAFPGKKIFIATETTESPDALQVRGRTKV
jgi:hypothetical protein